MDYIPRILKNSWITILIIVVNCGTESTKLYKFVDLIPQINVNSWITFRVFCKIYGLEDL